MEHIFLLVHVATFSFLTGVFIRDLVESRSIIDASLTVMSGLFACMGTFLLVR